MKKKITILVPVYNESQVLPFLYKELTDAVAPMDYDFQFLFINDGSTDESFAIIAGMAAKDPRVCCVDFSRNHGKEIAMAAGFDYAAGDAVIIMDADLQHPPQIIKKLIAGWEEGYDDVYTRKVSRKGESPLKRATSRLFYFILEKLTRLDINKGASDFRLLSRAAVNELRRFRETQRYTKGLYTEIGFPKKAVEFEQQPRFAGKTKWSYIQLTKLAIEGVTSFSIMPLRLATVLGMITGIAAMFSILWIVIKYLACGEPVAGYPTIMCTILFIGSVQLICTGIIGEYLGRVFKETKHRPLYIVKQYLENKSQKNG